MYETVQERIYNKMTKGMTIKIEELKYLGLTDILITQGH